MSNELESNTGKIEVVADVTELAKAIISGELPNLNEEELNNSENLLRALLSGIDIIRDARKRMAEIAPQLGSLAQGSSGVVTAEVKTEAHGDETEVYNPTEDETDSGELPGDESDTIINPLIDEDTDAGKVVDEEVEVEPSDIVGAIDDTQGKHENKEPEQLVLSQQDQEIISPEKTDEPVAVPTEEDEVVGQTKEDEASDSMQNEDEVGETRDEPEVSIETRPEEADFKPEVNLIIKTLRQNPGKILRKADFDAAGFASAKGGSQTEGAIGQAFVTGINTVTNAGIAEKVSWGQYVLAGTYNQDDAGESETNQNTSEEEKSDFLA